MGVDACLFLKNNKKHYYFDRLYNIENFDYDCDDYENTQTLYNLLLQDGINQKCFLLFLELNKRNAIKDKSPTHWIDKLWKIATLFPSETFFVRSDIHDDFYDLCNEYEEIDEDYDERNII